MIGATQGAGREAGLPQRPVGVVVDSGAGFGRDLPAGCVVVPLRIDIGGRLLMDGVDVTLDEVYARLAAGEAVGTSTPSPGDYLEAFRASPGAHVVCLTIAAPLSGMHASAVLAARLLGEEGDHRPVTVVDTGTAAAGFGLVARAAAELAAAGGSPPQVLDRIGLATAETVTIGSLRTLGYLARSGRVPRLVAGLGDLIGVRPIFELRHGEARRLQLVRGERRVLRAFAHAALRRTDPEHPAWLLVCHAAAPAAAAAVRAELHSVLRIGRSETVALSPVLGAYTGPGMTGFAVMPLRGAELAGVP